jgi:FMN phosphatase YigB (HAD superfamily)
MKYEAIIFDFDGVLCHDRFYEKSLLPENEHVYRWIQSNIFSNHQLIHDWMRGKIKWQDINKIISEATGVNQTILDKLFIDSVQKMNIDHQMLQFCHELKKLGIKIAIVTDNMDIFSEITTSRPELKKIFDVIINSADFGLLKKDGNGKLFEIALKALKCDIKNSLLIDDSKSTTDFYKKMGGNCFYYQDFQRLKTWLNTNSLHLN